MAAAMVAGAMAGIGVNVQINVTVPVRGLHRTREATETEPVTWLLQQEDAKAAAWGARSQASAQYADIKQARLRSLASSDESVIMFSNNSGRRVRALWIDFQGNEVAYSIIDPAAKKKYRTYQTHPWIMRDVETNERMALGKQMTFVATAHEHSVSINVPPVLPWKLETHKFFPPSFKDASRSLLLAHRRLRYSPAPATPAPLDTMDSDWVAMEDPSRAHSMEAFYSASELAAMDMSQPVTSLPLPGFDATLACLGTHHTKLPSTHIAMGLEPCGPAEAMMMQQDEDAMDVCRDDEAEQAVGSSSTSPPTMCPKNPASALLSWVERMVKRASPRLTSVLSPQRRPKMAQTMSRRMSSDEQPIFPALLAAVSAAASPRQEDPAAAIPWEQVAELPEELVLRIISFMAPNDVLQCIDLGAGAYPDIKPTIVASDPATWEPVQAAPEEVGMDVDQAAVPAPAQAAA